MAAGSPFSNQRTASFAGVVEASRWPGSSWSVTVIAPPRSWDSMRRRASRKPGASAAITGRGLNEYTTPDTANAAPSATRTFPVCAASAGAILTAVALPKIATAATTSAPPASTPPTAAKL